MFVFNITYKINHKGMVKSSSMQAHSGSCIIILNIELTMRTYMQPTVNFYFMAGASQVAHTWIGNWCYSGVRPLIALDHALIRRYVFHSLGMISVIVLQKI